MQDAADHVERRECLDRGCCPRTMADCPIYYQNGIKPLVQYHP